MQESRKREIRIKADSFRENCKIGRYGIIDLFKDCTRCGYKLLRYPLGESTDLGFSLLKDQDIIIFTNSSSRLSREIFTLAHEIGHIILHINANKSFIDDHITLSGKNTDEKEQEANYFAANLLMPDDEIGKFLDLEIENSNQNKLSATDIAKIMSEFNVSFDMALNRLENLGKMNASEKLQLDNERNEKRVGNLLRSISGNSRLNIASEEIDIPYEYIDYVIYNYNHRAIPAETLERALAYCHLSREDISDRLVDSCDEENDADLDDMIGGLPD